MNTHKPKSIITSHMNADFDALSSIIAAGKLYPDATLILPSILERQVTNEFSTTLEKRFHFRHPKECDFSEVSLLIVTDTRKRSRLVHIEPVFGNPKLEIHLYDHHPDSSEDLKGSQEKVLNWGSSTAILTLIIKERNIELTQDEATALMIGIHEDTGSFMFSSTTEYDLSAAAFLLSHKANLNIVHELMKTDLTSQQVHILGSLLKNAEIHTFYGIPVTITDIILDHFLGDFSSIVDKFIDIENSKVIFCLAVMDDRIHLIARSYVPQIDASKICAAFGGGGHESAASASIVELTMNEVKPKLLSLLASSIRPQMTVGSQMTSPAKALFTITTITTAAAMMSRYGLKAVPVLDKDSGECVGILDLETANRADSHHLGEQPVADYLQDTFATLEPEADLYQAMDIILKQRQRLIPITRNNHVQGVLTRTDILRLFVDESSQVSESSQRHSERKVVEMLKASLPAPIMKVLEQAGAVADSMQVNIFVVGGFVRDLLLNRPNFDIDLSVEGDGIAFAETLAKALGGETRHHPKFKTAVVFYKDSEGNQNHLDIATSRLEFYDSPGALPTIELSSIKMDLSRRDFTMNALAIQLNASKFGTLIDSFGGQRDIKAKRISILHSLSFIEDPTRILRAIRFEQRYQFTISQQTERLIKNAQSLHMIDNVSGARLFRELLHIFKEKNVVACLKRMQEWNILQAIFPKLQVRPKNEKNLIHIEEILSWYIFSYKDQPISHWIPYMLELCSNIKHPDVKSLFERLALHEKLKKDFFHLRWLIQKASKDLTDRAKAENKSLRELYTILQPLPIEGQLYLLAKYKDNIVINEDILLYITKINNTVLEITGNDLLSMGFPQGPYVGETLKQILMEKLDGNASNKEEQLTLAVKYKEKLTEKELPNTTL